ARQFPSTGIVVDELDTVAELDAHSRGISAAELSRPRFGDDATELRRPRTGTQ
ncbi:DNA recombination protein RmuC, partial [Burkholderia multivorans]